MAVCQNLVPLVNIKIAGKWMFIPLKMVLIGIDPYPYGGWRWMDPTEYLGSLAAESQFGGKHACGQSIQLPALKESQFKHHTTSNELKAFDLDDASQRFKCSN